MSNKSTPDPPRFEKVKARSQASSALIDMLTEMLLKSDAPEEAKLGMRIVQQGKKVCATTMEIVTAFAGEPDELKPNDTETLKQVLEYLGLVEVGLKQFMETTKAPNANNAPNEI